MIVNDLIVMAQKELEAHQLEPNVAFKILFFVYPKIKDLITYHEYKNDKLSWYKTSLYKRYLHQYINLQKPLQYITHEAFFYKENFIVLNKVHIPKIETETMIDIAKNLLATEGVPRVLDLCCGTGILGVSLALEKNIDLTMVDISHRAIKNSILNTALHHIDAKIIKSNLFESVSEQYDLIMCNPPYVDIDDKNLEYSVKKYEDKKAIIAKNNGWFFYQEIMKDVHKYLKPNGKIIFEIGFNQKDEVWKICEQNEFVKHIEFFNDSSNHNRFIVVYF